MRFPSTHIPFEQLADLVERRLSGDELAEARQHLTAANAARGRRPNSDRC